MAATKRGRGYDWRKKRRKDGTMIGMANILGLGLNELSDEKVLKKKYILFNFGKFFGMLHGPVEQSLGSQPLS
jgi:hypothetical protein